MKHKRNVLRVLVATGLTVGMTSGIALASIGSGTVNANALRLRSEASTASDILSLVCKNSVVTLLDQISDEWYRVSYNDTVGYMASEWLDVGEDGGTADETVPETLAPEDSAPVTIQGYVNSGPLNVRSGAGTSYGKVGTLSKGAAVTIVGDSVSGWYQVTSGNLTGYVSAQYITIGDAPAAAPETTPSTAVNGVVTASVLNVRSGAGTSYGKVATLSAGDSVTIVDDSVSGWYQITSGNLTGYVSSAYVSIPGANSSSVGAAAANLAASLVGCRYSYGASGPSSFDCSGLTYYIYRQLGYSISRGSSSQYYQSGYFVSTSDLQPGDLIFFFDPRFDSSGGTLPTTHVGIYAGNNQFIHASTTSYRVQYDTLFGGYFGPYVVAAKRFG